MSDGVGTFHAQGMLDVARLLAMLLIDNFCRPAAGKKLQQDSRRDS